MTARCEVLVVGAGPTGLTMALQLARRGIGVRIIDRAAGPSSESRAAVVHARTLEYLEQLGLADEALRCGRPLSRVVLVQRGAVRAELPITRVGIGRSAFPFILSLGQDRTEAILLAALHERGIEVERRREVTGLEEDAQGVRVRLADGAVIDADWLAACDGASSFVRHALSIPFEGGSYEHRFYLADCRVDGAIPDDGVTVCPDRRSLVAFFAMAGDRRFRVIGKVPREMARESSLPFDRMAAIAAAGARIPVRLSDPRWTSVYALHHRAVDRLRAGRGGRIFLLGDAAHVHSPVGGQGMNTGIQDATNLAWKLALVVRGAAQESLLDTFQEERMPVIRTLLRTTDRFFVIATSEHPVVATLRGWLFGPFLRAALGVRAVRERAFAGVSQIGIGYERGSLADAARAAGAAGTRGRAAPGRRLPFGEFAGGDGRPRSIEALCGAPWFTAIVIGTDRGAYERIAAAPLPDPLARFVSWRWLEASPANGSALRALGAPPAARASAAAGEGAARLVLVRPDLHLFGAWPAADAPKAFAALRRALG